MAEASEAETRKLAELGRLLAAAEGYLVLNRDGRQLGHVDHVRYQRYTDRPDEIVVRRGWPWRRTFVVPFRAVAAVDRSAGTVTVTSSSVAARSQGSS